MHPPLTSSASRIIEFARDVYVTTQTQDAAAGFISAEPELRSLLRSRAHELSEAVAWMDRVLSASTNQVGNVVNVTIDPSSVPNLIKVVFAFLANKAAIGPDAPAFASLVHVAPSQTTDSRAALMRSVVLAHFSKPIVALEIRTWFGVGSTRVWIDTLPLGSSLVLLDTWRGYISADDDPSGLTPYHMMHHIPQVAMASTLREVLKAEAADRGIEIVVIRGRSSSMLDLLRDDSFDFVYIDGSHYYADVKRDVVRAKQLARRSLSIVSGDDLNTWDRSVIEAARPHVNRDVATVNGVDIHPGVALAVSEEFLRVNMENAFWWALQRDGVWGT